MKHFRMRSTEQAFDLSEFVSEYSDYYFGNTPSIEGAIPSHVFRLNTSSEIVEKKAGLILRNGITDTHILDGISFVSATDKKNKFVDIPFDENDENSRKTKVIFFILAWKKGCIIHNACDDTRFVFYSKSRYDSENNTYVLTGSPTIAFNANLVDVVYSLKIKDSDAWLNKALETIITSKYTVNVGFTYAITLLYFASKGRYPIYDAFAYRALVAITSNNGNKYSFGEFIKEKDVTLNRDKNNGTIKNLSSLISNVYKPYIEMLESKPFKDKWRLSDFTDDSDEDKKKWNFARNIDRALWVYGHFFAKPTND